MKTTLKTENLAKLFWVLSDTTRIQIITMINHRELNTRELEELLEFSYAKVNRHMQYFKNIGLMKTRKDRQSVYYFINPEFKEAVEVLLSIRSPEDVSKDIAKLDSHAHSV